jgi:hypothetical protein
MITKVADLGVLIRLLSVAEELAQHEPTSRADNAGRRLGQMAYLHRVHAITKASLDTLDSGRGALLRELVMDPDGEPARHPEAGPVMLSVVRGYLKGCVEELTFEQQMLANAAAYGEAKVRDEKGYL